MPPKQLVFNRLVFCLLLLAGGLAGGLGVGCGSVEQAPLDQTLWVFAAEHPSPRGFSEPAAAPLTAADALRVERVRVQRPYADTRIFYRTGTQSLKPDPYRRYAAAPADLLTHQLVAWLQAGGRGLVVGPAETARAGTRLQLSVRELVLDHRDQPAASIVVHALVLQDDQNGSQVLLDRVYRASAPIMLEGLNGDAAMAASMQALGEAVAEVYAALGNDLPR